MDTDWGLLAREVPNDFFLPTSCTILYYDPGVIHIQCRYTTEESENLYMQSDKSRIVKT